MAAKRVRKRASKTTTKTARRPMKKVAARAKRPAARASKAIHELTPAKRKQVLLGIRKVLRVHNIAENLAELHFEPAEAEEAAAPEIAPAAAPERCPPNTRLRIVCVPDAFGTMHCGPRCVPNSTPVIG